MEGLVLQDLIYISPELVLVITGMILLFLKNFKHISFLITSGAMVMAGMLHVLFFNVNQTFFFATLDVTDFSAMIRLLIISGTIIFVLATKDFADELTYSNLYYSFLIFATTGMIILPSANDILTLFIAFEMTSISSYALPFIDQKYKNRHEAGIKYFLTGIFSSALVLFGMSYLFGLTGSLYLSDISDMLVSYSGEPIVYLAFALIFGGVSYKMALAPFHLWAPDTYTGSPAPATAYLAGIAKKGPFAFFVKLFIVGFAAIRFEVIIAVGILAVITMFIGNLAALVQTNVKRMLAFSSVANAGTILVGFAVNNLYGISGAFLHFWAHMLMTIGAFIFIFYLEEKYNDVSYDGVKGLSKKEPLLVFMFTIILLSFSGIPPLLGFWSKLIIVFGAVDAGGWYLALALALIINSALSLAYYFKVIKNMYMKDAMQQAPALQENQGSLKEYLITKIGVCAIAVVLFITGLIPRQILSGIINAVEQFLG